MEHAHNNGREDTRQEERITRQSQLKTQSTMDKDQPLEQSINVRSQKITRKRNKTPTMIRHQVQEWPIPLTPPDAQEGLEVIMAAINEWLERQEHLKLFQPTEGEDQSQLDGTIQLNIQTGSNSTPVFPTNQLQDTTWQEEHNSSKELQQLEHLLTLTAKPQPTLTGLMNHSYQVKVQKNKSQGLMHQPTYPGAMCPTHPVFYQCYDLRIQLKGPNKQVYSEWEVLSTFLLQLSEIDQTIVLLPWKVADQLQEYYSAKSVTKLDKFFDILTYVPHLVSLKPGWSKYLQAGQVCHPQIFLSSMLKPVNLVKKMSTWLKGQDSCHKPNSQYVLDFGTRV